MYPIERFLFTLKSFVRNRAHPEGYVLFNNNNVDLFQREHIDHIKRQNRNRRLSPYEIDKIHSRTFSDWFRERVARLEEQGSVIVTDEIKWLARGPLEIWNKNLQHIWREKDRSQQFGSLLIFNTDSRNLCGLLLTFPPQFVEILYPGCKKFSKLSFILQLT
ncbi:hypothetical protein P8452_23894 [Trifolium repens]|nr:hypothetical protein P8452_23894 [Trifolium repens]